MRLSTILRQAIWALCLLIFLLGCTKALTQDKFDEVKQGMSMKQVVAILGPPTTADSISIAGLSGTSATWKTKDAQVAIQFLNDQVTVKIFNKLEKDTGEESIQPDTH